jgi:hypothetical protein
MISVARSAAARSAAVRKPPGTLRTNATFAAASALETVPARARSSALSTGKYSGRSSSPAAIPAA